MTRDKIFQDVIKERERQEEKHPVKPKCYLSTAYDPSRKKIRQLCERAKIENNIKEANENHSWYGIGNEELLEIFAADNDKDRYTEIVHTIAVLFRMAENMPNSIQGE